MKNNTSKTNHKVSLTFITIAMLIIFVFISYFIFREKNDEQKILGTWNLVEYTDGSFTQKADSLWQYNFYNDNTAIFIYNVLNDSQNHSIEYKYKIDGNKLLLEKYTTEEDTTINHNEEYTFEFKRGKLLITDDNGLISTYEKNKGY